MSNEIFKIGHRGAKGHIIENTLESIQKALDLGVDGSDIKLSNITKNSSEIEFASSATSVNVYTDNWRVVSLETPTYSDFPE